MQRHIVRDRLVYPVAAAVALSIVTVPHAAGVHGSRLVEVSAVRLQAEVSTYIGGLPDAAVFEPAANAPASAASTTAAATSWSYNPAYTFLDNIVYNLPPKIRDLVIPPLYVFAAVLGVVMAVPMFVITSIGKLVKPSAATARAAATEPTGSSSATSATISTASTRTTSAAPSVAGTVPSITSAEGLIAPRAARTAPTGKAHSRKLAPAPAAAAVGHSAAVDHPDRAHIPSPRAAKRSAR